MIEGPIRRGVLTMYFHRQVWRGVQEVITWNGSLPDSALFQVRGRNRRVDVVPDLPLLTDSAALVSLNIMLSPDWLAPFEVPWIRDAGRPARGPQFP